MSLHVLHVKLHNQHILHDFYMLFFIHYMHITWSLHDITWIYMSNFLCFQFYQMWVIMWPLFSFSCRCPVNLFNVSEKIRSRPSTWMVAAFYPVLGAGIPTRYSKPYPHASESKFTPEFYLEKHFDSRLNDLCKRKETPQNTYLESSRLIWLIFYRAEGPGRTALHRADQPQVDLL